ncbi:LuxR C-terminal-related transcriptional regulator [Streptomyces sp. NPDC006975]|uniref:helix-turn-helix transcriptional regulator n=1 Tax=Streptomyces sp. NPDC006975 TaxID=3154310 RepID=UPI003454A47B
MTADAPGVMEIRGALARLRRGTGLPVAFGGLVDAGHRWIRISELNGNDTAALRSLAVTAGNGLGGKAIALARPCAVVDYSSSQQISHEYDAAVAEEGLRSVLAVPVVVRRRVRGVLYGALRSAQPLGDRVLGAAVAAARDVEQALVVRDEVGELLAVGAAAGAAAAGAARAGGAAAAAGAGAGAGWEQVREAHAALRALAPRIGDPALRAELLAVCGLLTPGVAGAGASGGVGAAGASGGVGVALTPREVDVLACVAAGATNAGAGERLGLGVETVKSYLRSAMRKLGAHTRGEAVAAARRAGALP